MTQVEFDALKKGDTVRAKYSGRDYKIIDRNADVALAADVRLMTNPDEWELVADTETATGTGDDKK